MMTGLAYGSGSMVGRLPDAWIFIVVFLLLIALIFVRVYVLGDWFRRRAAHRSGQRTVHRASHVPERGGSHGPQGNHGPQGSHGHQGNHGHQTASRRRQHRP